MIVWLLVMVGVKVFELETQVFVVVKVGLGASEPETVTCLDFVLLIPEEFVAVRLIV